ncbi:MAG: hypothetical protein V1921_06500 [Candidatus Altiarchaeota archaeon]
MKLEDGSADRLPRLKGDTVAEALRFYELSKKRRPDSSQEDVYDSMLKDTKQFNVSSEELQMMHWRLEEAYGGGEWYAENAGIYLTTLMQNSNQRRFVIEPVIPLDFFGMGLSGDKEVLVKGDVGDNLGFRMEDGRITVEGKAADYTGWLLKGGELMITGDAGELLGFMMEKGSIAVGGSVTDYLGKEMKDGKITVRGNAGRDVAEDSRGGVILIGGTYESASRKRGATIVMSA